MRHLAAASGVLLLGFGFVLLNALLYDASAVTSLARLDPARSEGLVAALGLGLVALAIASGFFTLRRSLSARARGGAS